MKALLTPAQVADKLLVPPGTLANWRYLGVGPKYVKLNGSLIRYEEAALEEWVEAQANEAKAS